MLALIVGKMARAVLRRLGRGSVLPGRIALRLNKDLLSKFSLPPVILAVTGSGGKTTTTTLLRDAATNAGLTVVSNAEGSNMAPGIVTALMQASDLSGRVRGDAVILECEERHCQYLFPDLTPSHVIVTNLSRDQVSRNGSPHFVGGELAKALDESMTLIVNADDPLVTALGQSVRTIGMSVEAEQLRERPGQSHVADERCPRCGGPLTYQWRVLGHLGSFHCPTCGFAHGSALHRLIDAHGATVDIDEVRITRPQPVNPASAYNILAAYCGLVEALGVDPPLAADALSRQEEATRRSVLRVAGRDARLFLSKHENPLTWDVSLRLIVDEPISGYVLGVAVHKISRKYFTNDVSWLWDIDWEILRTNPPAEVVIGGRFSSDLALRLSEAGLNPERMRAVDTLESFADALSSVDDSRDLLVLTSAEDLDPIARGLREVRA